MTYLQKYYLLFFLFTHCGQAWGADPLPPVIHGLSDPHIFREDFEKLKKFVYKHLGAEEAPTETIRKMPKDAASLMFDKLVALQKQGEKLVSQLEELRFELKKTQNDFDEKIKILQEQISELEKKPIEKNPSDSLSTSPSHEIFSVEQAYEKAQEYIKQDQLERGITLLKEIYHTQKSHPLWAKAGLDLSTLMMKDDHFKDATSCAMAVYKEAPESHDGQQALFHVAKILIKMNKSQEAGNILRKLLETPLINPGLKTAAETLQHELAGQKNNTR